MNIIQQNLIRFSYVDRFLDKGLALTLPACIKNFTTKSKIPQNSWLSQRAKFYQLIFGIR